MTGKHEKWQKKDTSRSDDEKLDDALDDSFPASDPPAQTEPMTKVGSTGKSPHEAPRHR